MHHLCVQEYVYYPVETDPVKKQSHGRNIEHLYGLLTLILHSKNPAVKIYYPPPCATVFPLCFCEYLCAMFLNSKDHHFFSFSFLSDCTILTLKNKADGQRWLIGRKVFLPILPVFLMTKETKNTSTIW